MSIEPTENRPFVRRSRGARSALAATCAALVFGACGGRDDAAPAGGEPVTTSATSGRAVVDLQSSASLQITTSPESRASPRSGGKERKQSPTTPASKSSRPKSASTAVAPTTTAVAPTTTTVAPTTTTIPLPRPIDPPLDSEAPEPVVPLGRIAIPAIGVDRPMYEGIRIPTFDLGPGHWPGSALPGQVGNMILGGHRTSMNADFRDIDQLVPGHEVVVTTNDGTSFTYVVESSEITDPDELRVTAQTPAKTATLFACHPPGEVTQRIVVHLLMRE